MIRDRVEVVRRRITDACRRTGRDPAKVTLVAVAKTFPADQIREVVRCGVRDIGENYVQELLGKREELGAEQVRWHFVGHLQSNKVRQLAEWITLVHALDSVELARELDRRAARAGRVVDVLVEVNTTGERTKFGLPPERTVGFVAGLAPFRNVRVAGLMTIGPFLPDPEGSRPMFRRLRDLREEAARLGQDNVSMEHLSMGMTGDFEVAIEEGATLVRIGTAIFGPRKKRATTSGGSDEGHTA